MTPQIIHQTWKTENVPERLRPYQESWWRHHPTWEYRFWTDDDNLQLVRERYPHLVDFYQSLPYPILKVEFSKLFYLDSFGGLYIDLDFEALKPVDDLFCGNRIVMGQEIGGLGGMTRGREYIMNAIIGSPPGHPFWKGVIDESVAKFRLKRPWELREIYVINRVIEIIDAHAIRYCKSHEDLVILSHESLYPSPQSERCADARRELGRKLNSYAVHHYDDSWFSPWLKGVTAVRYALHRTLARCNPRRLTQQKDAGNTKQPPKKSA